MNILFLTLLDFSSIDERNIYTDLLRTFAKKGDNVFAVSPVEKKKNFSTRLIESGSVKILKLQIGNTQQTNFIEKGISTLRIEGQFIEGIKKYFSNVKFDIVLYSTPPITLCRAVEFVKKRDDAKTYLMLKDIFPQNALDLGILKKSGVTGIIYNHFRNKEKKLYEISDFIGCMSKANVDFLLKNNPSIDASKVEECPNCVEIADISVNAEQRSQIRDKYAIPQDKKIFIYGGNLGKPQGIDFLIKCLKSQEKNDDVYFLIVGNGTEFGKIENYIKHNAPRNIKLMPFIPGNDYNILVGACDVGLIFLDYRFTVPNFPSRLLTYMQAKIPTLAVTDRNTDVGNIIVEGKFGWWCESNDVDSFCGIVNNIIKEDLKTLGENGFNYLCEHYSVERNYNTIINRVREKGS